MASKYVSAAVKCLLLSASLALSNLAAQRSLSPLFGSVAATANFSTIWMTSLYIPTTVPPTWFQSSKVASRILMALSAIWSLAPVILYRAGSYYSKGGKEATFGPLMTQIAMTAPAAALCSALAVRWSEPVQSSMPNGPMGSTMYIAGLLYLASWVTEDYLWTKLPQGGLITNCNIYMALAAVASLASVLESYTSDTAAAVPEAPAPAPTASSSTKKSTTKSTPGKPVKVETPTPAYTYNKSQNSLARFLPLLVSPLFLSITKSQRPCSSPSYPYATGPDNSIRVLASNESISGLITVAEANEFGFRYLRCDHSILGGVWVGDEQRTKGMRTISTTEPGSTETKEFNDPPGGWDVNHERLGDSIYSAFVLQEGVRLFDRGRSKKIYSDGEEHEAGEAALIVGLGAGVAARAFALHNISTTILEVDPVVHSYAQTFFGLPSLPGAHYSTELDGIMDLPIQTPQTYIMDARKYIAKRAEVMKGMRPVKESIRYDFVVHDCFSGGMVPTHLFSTEVWDDLKVLMKTDGILAVNFAGKVGSKASRAILKTLEHSFEKCRIFHDRMYNPDAKDNKDEEFLNMVFFCTQSPDIPMNFRQANPNDFLNSYLRQHVFSTFEWREVAPEDVVGTLPDMEKMTAQERMMAEDDEKSLVLTDARNMLGHWQKESALEHWTLMRSVLSDANWEAY